MQKFVLLVEDDSADILLMKRATVKTGFRFPLAWAENGQQAMDYLDGRNEFADRTRFPLPSHVVLDIKLPLRNGLEVLSWLRACPGLKGLPVIIFTSSSERQDIQSAYRLAIDGYLHKPVGLERLATVVRAIANWVETGRLDPLQELIPPEV